MLGTVGVRVHSGGVGEMARLATPEWVAHRLSLARQSHLVVVAMATRWGRVADPVVRRSVTAEAVRGS